MYQPKVAKTIETIVLSTALICMQQQAFAQSSVTPIPATCTLQAGVNNYSGTVGSTSAVLIPAPPAGVVRSGIFIQMLDTAGTLAINPMGQSASSTAPGNMVTNTGYGGFNFSAMNFIPTGAITAKADTDRVVSAWACPR